MSEPLQPSQVKRSLFPAFWQLTRPYWASDEKWKAWGLLALVVALNLGMVYISVLFNDWYRAFYDSLQNLDRKAFWESVARFFFLAVPWVLVQIYAVYFRQMLEVRWRRWMTHDFSARWLSGQGYYRLQLADVSTDNPDQRIAEDIDLFVSSTLRLSLGLLRNVVSLVTFISILWVLSGPLRFTLGETSFNIPGYMVWAAVLYAAVGTAITIWIGRKLVGINFEQQRREADFRFSLIRVRENAEAIALYRGEQVESARLAERFAGVVENFWAFMRMTKRVGGFTFSWGQMSVLFPYLMAGHRLFSGQIKLGGLMQIGNAFKEVNDALTYIMDSFGELARWKSVIDRLQTFELGLAKAAAMPVLQPQLNGASLAARVDVHKPDGSVLLNALELELQPGQRLLVQGASGGGKSTLLRTLSGIWPFASGSVVLPAQTEKLFLSQKPYLPLGSLRDAICYPMLPNVDGMRLQALLQQVGLAHLAGNLDAVRAWSHELSLGEQQRIAIARALLLQPGLLVLDEATSAIDEPTETKLYQTLIDTLPNTILISVGHRSSLRQFHTRFLDCLGDGRWALA